MFSTSAQNSFRQVTFKMFGHSKLQKVTNISDGRIIITIYLTSLIWKGVLHAVWVFTQWISLGSCDVICLNANTSQGLIQRVITIFCNFSDSDLLFDTFIMIDAKILQTMITIKLCNIIYDIISSFVGLCDPRRLAPFFREWNHFLHSKYVQELPLNLHLLCRHENSFKINTPAGWFI